VPRPDEPGIHTPKRHGHTGTKSTRHSRWPTAGIAALVLITKRRPLACEDDTVLTRLLKRFLAAVSDSLPLGPHECSYLHKRLVSPELMRFCVATSRFGFSKDTSCRIGDMQAKRAARPLGAARPPLAGTACREPDLMMGTTRSAAAHGAAWPDLAVGLRNHIPPGAPATREPVDAPRGSSG